MPDYGYQLQDYASDYFKDNVALEFTNQMRAWKTHMRTMVQYTRDASDLHTKYLQEVEKDLKKTSLLEDLALMALSLMGGVAISFISGALQYNVGQRIFSKTNVTPKNTPAYLPNIARPTPTNKPPVVKEPAAVKTPPNVESIKIPNAPPGSRPGIVTTPAPSLKYTQPKPQPSPKPKPPNIQVPKEIPKPLYLPHDVDLSKTQGKVLGDFGGEFAGFGLSALSNWADPGDTKTRNMIAAVPSSVNIEAFKTNMENVWDAAETYCLTALQKLADLFHNPSGWGERFWKALVAGEKQLGRRINEFALLDKGKVMIRLVAFNQRRSWANNPAWFYFSHEPTTLSQAHSVAALEAELWALWIRTEGFSWGFDTKGISGIPLAKILPRLVQLGIMTGTDEIQRRTNAKNNIGPHLLPAEIKDVDGMFEVREEQFRSLMKWAHERPITLLGGQYAYTKRALLLDLPKGR